MLTFLSHLSDKDSMNPFIQSPCQRCGATVFIPTATGVGYCPQCHTPAQLQPGNPANAPMAHQEAIPATVAIPAMATPQGYATGAPSPWGAPPAAVSSQAGGFPQGFGQAGSPPQNSPFGAPQHQQGGFGAPQQHQQGGFGAPQQQGGFGAPQQQGGFGVPAGYNLPPGMGGYGQQAPPKTASAARFLVPIIGLFVLVCVASFAIVGARALSKTGLKKYDIEAEHADPDAAIRAAGDIARGWQPDAVFQSINIVGMRTDGTVDLSNSSNSILVEYFSLARVSSFVEAQRRDSIKKITFRSTGATHNIVWGVRRRVERPSATPFALCTARQLGALLAQQGVPPTALLTVQYDPQFALAVNGAFAWHVTSSAPVLDRWYDAGSCTFLRGN
jgi:hypothetical protein